MPTNVIEASFGQREPRSSEEASVTAHAPAPAAGMATPGPVPPVAYRKHLSELVHNLKLGASRLTQKPEPGLVAESDMGQLLYRYAGLQAQAGTISRSIDEYAKVYEGGAVPPDMGLERQLQGLQTEVQAFVEGTEAVLATALPNAGRGLGAVLAPTEWPTWGKLLGLAAVGGAVVGGAWYYTREKPKRKRK
jgi:hypothetical protein